MDHLSRACLADNVPDVGDGGEEDPLVGGDVQVLLGIPGDLQIFTKIRLYEIGPVTTNINYAIRQLVDSARSSKQIDSGNISSLIG